MGVGSAARLDGLSASVAGERLRTEGYNDLPRSKRRSAMRVVAEVLREPMLVLLLASGVIYLVLGDLKEALLLLVFATMSIVITAVQELRAERALEALRDLSSPRALVVRDGRRTRIAGREVVRGDLVVLAEGDRVPADACIVEGADLQLDESLLTGEPVPVRKRAAADSIPPPARPGGDDQPFVYSGSLVVRGSGFAEVTATGIRSEIGKIGHSLAGLTDEPPRLRTEIRRLVYVFAAAGAAISILAFVLYGVLRGDWLAALLGGIALGMSMLPEEFPVILTVFLVMGAWRMSRVRVLTRKIAAIEALGAATVLCTDKTGTLTENRMTVSELCLANGENWSRRSQSTLPQSLYLLAETAIRASAPSPFDPMERAIHDLRNELQAGGVVLADDATLVRAYGLRPDLLAVANVWRPAEGQVVVAAKGAPEAIAQLCRMPAFASAALTRDLERMAGHGLRVLGVARARAAAADPNGQLPDYDFEFLGLVGLTDPLRASVPDAVAECRAAGIRIVMITGDYPVTARAIARDGGLDAGAVLAGADIANMSDSELRDAVRTTPIFARITPDQKLRIVTALKQNGETVAMTGDGVNDASSLKAAHIGIAMGGRGTDVAREASSIVLLDDDFGSIVSAARLGRRIYDNLRKAMTFVLAVHVPVAGLAILPLLFGLPILLGPVHIAFLEMVVDPVCSLAFETEPEEDDLMRRKPRAAEDRLLSGRLMAWAAIQGTVVLALVAVIVFRGYANGMVENELRALAFFSVVLGVISLIFVNRSISASPVAMLITPNLILTLVLVVVAAIMSLTLVWPWAATLFRFGPLHLGDLLDVTAAGVVTLVVLTALKSQLRGWVLHREIAGRRG